VDISSGSGHKHAGAGHAGASAGPAGDTAFRRGVRAREDSEAGRTPPYMVTAGVGLHHREPFDLMRIRKVFDAMWIRRGTIT
jgi:hypothetical protein